MSDEQKSKGLAEFTRWFEEFSTYIMKKFPDPMDQKEGTFAELLTTAIRKLTLAEKAMKVFIRWIRARKDVYSCAKSFLDTLHRIKREKSDFSSKIKLFVIPLFNFLLPFRLKPFRGGYYSLVTVPWYFHNAFTYIVRYTFLEFVTPTPLNILFYRMMGMKIGKGAHINTTNISDPALIEIEDKVTIGGSVHIIAHYASKGYLIVERVKIQKGATVGLKATIMGDVEIGE